MGVILGWKEVQKQSQVVFDQFGEKVWIPNAKRNVKLPRRDVQELQNAGIGKHLVLAAVGESLAAEIETLKKFRDKVDILTCDKGFELLLKNGIKADYVMLCDANIPYEHIKDSINETKGVKLLATPYANPEWTENWKGDRYFYVNKDALETEKIFLDIFGQDIRAIPAGSNVSNAMLIFFTGSDEYQNYNWGGYSKYILVGYDYSWRPDGNYYAWKNPKPKRFYMNHRTMLDMNNDTVFTSENLLFSVKWLYSYITVYNLPVVNCSARGLLDIPYKNLLYTELAALNPAGIENCRECFTMMGNAHKAFMNSKRLFEKSRGGLLWQ